MPGGTIPRFAWPVLITAANDTLGITHHAGPPIAATMDIPDGTYFWRYDGTAADLVQVFTVALGVAAGGMGWVVSLDSQARMVVEGDFPFSFLWATGGGDASAALFGFSGADCNAVLIGGTYFLTSDFQVGNYWSPGQIIVDASNLVPGYRAMQAVAMNDRQRVARWGPKRQRQSVTCDLVPPERVYLARETLTTGTNQAFERFWIAVGDGTRFEYCPSVAVPGTYYTRQIAEQQWLEQFEGGHCVEQIPVLVERYNVRVPMKVYIP